MVIWVQVREILKMLCFQHEFNWNRKFYHWLGKGSLKKTFYLWNFPQGGGDPAILHNFWKLKNGFFKIVKTTSHYLKLPPYFWAKNMKITSQKSKVTPLFFNENFKNNESKMFFPQKQGGGSGPCGKFHKKNCVFFLNLP